MPLFNSKAFGAVVLAVASTKASLLRTPTPPLGWNSYNFYSCFANETDIQVNAQALVDTGLADLGYVYVIPDCGWSAVNRTADGEIMWNTDLYPSGYPALSAFVHGLGLKFGIYSGAGTFQCHPDAGNGYHIQASLGHEQIDAQTFATWGGDYLKYDNCFADGVTFTSYVDNDPATRFDTMATALGSVDRGFVYGICQWGVGNNLHSWASKIGNSWRMSNDIFNAWSSIWRITNQVVPLAKFSQPGNYNDMDMLIIGDFGLTLEEQRTHMAIWAMEKSPLLIGAAVVDTTSLPADSLAVLSNPDVLAISQDPLGKAAQLVRRFSEEEYDLWAGDLSDSRKVLAIINWSGTQRNLTVDLVDAGVHRAESVRDVWASKNTGPIEGTYTATVPGHGIKLLIVGEIKASPSRSSASKFYPAASATLSGSAVVQQCAAAGLSGCHPTGSKVINMNTTADRIAFSHVSGGDAGGSKFAYLHYVNYDLAFDSSWTGLGLNVLNATFSVNNGTAKQWSFPISGGNWEDTGTMGIMLDGFDAGEQNTVQVWAPGWRFAPHIVGLEVPLA